MLRQLSGLECSTSAPTPLKLSSRPALPVELRGKYHGATTPRGGRSEGPVCVVARLTPKNNLQRTLLNQLARRQSQLSREKKDSDNKVATGGNEQPHVSTEGQDSKSGLESPTGARDTVEADANPDSVDSGFDIITGSAVESAATPRQAIDDAPDVPVPIASPAVLAESSAPLPPASVLEFDRGPPISPNSAAGASVVDLDGASPKTSSPDNSSTIASVADAPAGQQDSSAAEKTEEPRHADPTEALKESAPDVAAALSNRSSQRKLSRKTAALTTRWPPGSVEAFLAREGVPEIIIEDVVRRVIAWRVTKGGRVLVDRRRRNRVERNMEEAADYLEQVCGVERGPNGVGRILASSPMVLLCKPFANDRWDRRALELVAFRHQTGHCNVPDRWMNSGELSHWLKRQYVAVAQRSLTQERMAILDDIGVTFGAVQQITIDWEAQFDRLLDFKVVFAQTGQAFPWDTSSWLCVPDPRIWDLARWLELQRELARRNLTASDVVDRMEAIGMKWEPKRVPGGERWMLQCQQLIYHHYRHEQELMSKQYSSILDPASDISAADSADPPHTAPSSDAPWQSATTGTFQEWLPRLRGPPAKGKATAAQAAEGPLRTGTRDQVDAPIRRPVLDMGASGWEGDEGRGEGPSAAGKTPASALDVNPGTAFWQRLQGISPAAYMDPVEDSDANLVDQQGLGSSVDEGDITLSERVNGWVQCLTFVLGLLKDQPHLRISTALEPIDVMFGGNSRMHNVVRATRGRRMSQAIKDCRAYAAEREPPICIDLLVPDQGGGKVMTPSLRLPDELRRWLLVQQVCLARGRLRPWQAVMLGCLSADHDSAGLMFEVMARVLAAQAGSMPVTAAAAARLESLAQPCFPSRPGFEHQGVEDPSVSSESEDAVDTEGGKGQPDKRRRGRPKKHQDEASCSEGASPEDVYGGVGGVTRAGNVTAGAMEMLGASGGGVGLGWTGSALPVDLVKGAIPGSVVEVVPRADVWRLVPGARDRSHAARIIRRWLQMTQKEAAEGMLSPRRAQLLISLGVWHLVAARGLEGERRAVDERVMVMLRACEDGYGAWDVQLAAVIDAFADSAGAEEGNRDLPAELEQWAKKQTLAPESALGKQRVAQLRALGFTPAKAARKTPNAAKAKRSRAQRVRQVVRAGSR